MLKNSDLKKHDVLQFGVLDENYEAEYQKIIKFLGKQHGPEYGDYFLKKINSKELFNKTKMVFLGKTGTTEKTKTEFAAVEITFPGGTKLYLNIQTRYLRLKDRKSNHFFTKMFLNNK